MSKLKMFKILAVSFLATTMRNSSSYGDDTSKSANTRLPTDHEANIKNAQLKRYRKARKNGYIGTIEEFLGGLES